MSVSMTGLLFLPPEGTQFRPGSRAKQGSEIALYTLVGDEGYTAALAAEFYQWGTAKQWHGEGTLAGDATGGETVTQFWIPSHLALQSVLWLERTKGVTVLLSDSQRELLYLGTASSDAWRLLNVPKVAQEMDISLPAWYSEQLFRSQLAQNIGLLRSYIDAALLYHSERSEANRQGIVRVLTDIVFELEFHAAVLEGIRADTSLVGHWVYQLLWPTPRPEGLAEDEQPEPRQAPENRAPHPSIASQFLSFLHSQQSLVDRSWNETEARRELLDRFGRFLERSVSGPPSGDQQVRDQPATANTPPIPAKMSVSPTLSGPPGGPQFEASSEADYRFVMSIQFPDVFAAFQSYYYEWNYVRVPEGEQTASFDELDPQTPSGWDVAGQRFGRATRYAEEDFETVFEELGPPGVAATSLVAANAILRYVGEGIRLGIEILTTPASEKNIAFPGPGTYLVRCKAIPYTGENAEVVRPPSVAYYPIIVRDPVQLVESRNRERGATTAWEHERMAELRDLLSQPVSHLNEEQLRQELDTLERSLSSVGGALSVQREKLVEYRNSLPVGSADRGRVQTQLERLDVIIALRADRGEERDLTAAEPLVATFVSDKGESIQLTMEALYRGTEDGQVEYWVSDLTTANSGEDYGTGRNRAEAIMDAVVDILSGYAGYGRGYVAVQIDGETVSKRIKASAGALFMEAVENVAMVLSIAAVAAAPFTAGSSISLLLPIGAVGAIPSGYRVINRAIDDTLRFDMATAMDVVNVVGGFTGVGHAVTPLRMVKTGRAFYVMGLGADGLSGLLVPAEIATQIAALEGLPEGERSARIMEILGQAMLESGISVGRELSQRAQQRRMGTSEAPTVGESVSRPETRDVGPPGEAVRPGAREPDVAPERRPDDGEPRRTPEATGGRSPSRSLGGEPVTRRTQDGDHTLTLTKRGQIIRCSKVCQTLGARYAHILDDHPELVRRVASLEERAREAVAADDRGLADQVASDARVLEADLRAVERAWMEELGFDPDRIELLQQLAEERALPVGYDPAAEAFDELGLHYTRMDLDKVPEVYDKELGANVPMDISSGYPAKRGNLFDDQVVEKHEAAEGKGSIHAEVYVDTGRKTRNGRPLYWRADSWVPGEGSPAGEGSSRPPEIREHKFTQFSEIGYDRAVDYLMQLWSKYPPGAVIADVPSSRARQVEGMKLTGQQVLIVPEQIAPIPRDVLDAAEGFEITIRDIDGHVYTSK
ncbi:hypothetical protein SAMN04487947_3540 [Halogeometricum rufum]|uniref:Uncharacterized protein n=2 Tax=Halogeometricum rufum TaxID=553469 RepID=A0A1I6IQT8_9EURY|nr:hypothetical protein SAMN04487947_3540 [Halogeometricum rufum]